MWDKITIGKLLAKACDERTITHALHAELENQLRELEHKARAWDFLAAYNSPDPVPGAILGEYMDAAQTYATDYAPE